MRFYKIKQDSRKLFDETHKFYVTILNIRISARWFPDCSGTKMHENLIPRGTGIFKGR